ncbi:anoctamin-10-like [Convolutriloba macropyga]|uniref:anoctamin-10-like n=1 Tax=Convolutriloba macropyga TaxID=536237 RepID=UPI003F523EF5
MSDNRYVLVLSEKCSDQQLNFIIGQLSKNGLQGTLEDSEDGKVVLVTASKQCLESKAEEIGLEVPINKCNEGDLKLCMPFTTKILESDFFPLPSVEKCLTSGQRSLLLRLAIEDISVSIDLLPQYQIVLPKRLTNVKRVKLMTALKHSKPHVIEECFPLHDLEAKSALWKKIQSNPIQVPITAVREYFGEEVAFYFAWMNFFNITLIFPGLVGLYLHFMRPRGVDIDHAKYLPVFAVVVTVWATFFVIFWRRRQSFWAFNWDTIDFERVAEMRPEFFGEIRASPVTDLPEIYYPQWNKMLRYFVSFLAATPMLLLAVKAMLLSLNLNGYIKDHHSIFYVKSLCQYAEPGAIFAQDNPYYGWMVPTLLHSVIILVLNTIYRSIAVWCTDFENHKTTAEWNNSLIIKRFLFEAFDCYLPLFYIAFYRLDINSLRSELVGLFWGDELRRIALEVIVPFVLSWQKSRSAEKKYTTAKKEDVATEVDKQYIKELKEEEYEAFDDYLEMVIQFGYITLFASAMPLCSIISVVFLFIETKSDCFKLMFVNRRPPVRRAANIGVWLTLMQFMTISSIVTNVMLIGFSSEQLQVWFPQLYDFYDNDHWISEGSGRYVVGLVFCMEHLLLIFAALATWMISPESEKLKNRRLRKVYKQKEVEQSKEWQRLLNKAERELVK